MDLNSSAIHSAVIKHLAPATYYVFNVLAYNEAGHGPEVEDEIQTGGVALTKPAGLTARLVTPTSFNVSWQPAPSYHDDRLKWGYRLSWGLTAEELRWNRVDIQGEA